MLARIALRIAVVEALRGKTLVGDNVLDSEIGVLSAGPDGTIQTTQDRPFISVYTDTGVVGSDLAGLRALHENGMCTLVLETGVSTGMVERNEVGEPEIVQGLPGTDANFEMILDLVASQIADALTAVDEPWAIIFSALVERVSKIERGRVGQQQTGVRLAAQEFRIDLHLVGDPVRGEPLAEGGAFGLVLDRLVVSDKPAHKVLCERIAALAADVAPDWERARRQLGLSVEETAQLGIEPLVCSLDGSVPEFSVPHLDMEGEAP